MTQHSELVAYRRKVLNAQIWAKKTASIEMRATKDGNKTWTTKYNDGSITTITYFKPLHSFLHNPIITYPTT